MYKQYFVGQSFLTGNKCYSVEKKPHKKYQNNFGKLLDSVKWEVT